MKNEIKPNFYGIGAQKAGTSWLHYNLNRLPDFDLLPIKELHYFDRDKTYLSRSSLVKTNLKNRIKERKWFVNAIKEILFADTIKQKKFYFKWYFSNYNDTWYQSLYKNTSGFTGEITPSYSFLKIEDIERMYAVNPQAKLIFMVRNPIERAWSQFRYQSRHKKDFDINKILPEEMIAFMNSKNQILRSDYLATIKNYTKVFPKNHLLIGFFDSVAENPVELLREIVKFIGSNDKYIENYTQFSVKKNVSKEITCPSIVLEHLKNMYREPIENLAREYGSYFNVWLENYYPEEKVDTSGALQPAIIC